MLCPWDFEVAFGYNFRSRISQKDMLIPAPGHTLAAVIWKGGGCAELQTPNGE